MWAPYKNVKCGSLMQLNRSHLGSYGSGFYVATYEKAELVIKPYTDDAHQIVYRKQRLVSNFESSLTISLHARWADRKNILINSLSAQTRGHHQSRVQGVKCESRIFIIIYWKKITVNLYKIRIVFAVR